MTAMAADDATTKPGANKDLSPEEVKTIWQKLIQEKNKCQLEDSQRPKLDRPLSKDADQRVFGTDLEVFVRIRPLLPHELEKEELCVAFPSGDDSVLVTETRLDVRKIPRLRCHSFKVDAALGPTVATSDVQDALMGEPLKLARDGGVATVLAYGQTGTGKTFTVEGLLKGMVNEIFSGCEDKGLQIHLSFFELLGNNATDLLSEERTTLDILEDKFGQIVVKNAHEIELENPNHLQELLSKCLATRTTRSTFKNDTSSRSHAICKLRFENTRLKEVEDGKLFVVDLAGSESTSDSRYHDKTLVAETRHINKSLMALKECIRNRALSSLHPEKIVHVPYRQSKLTLLLKDAFELESHRLCKTVVIACVSPAQRDMSMSLNTLRYAAPFKIGQVNREKLKPDPDNPATWTNSQLREWVLSQAKGAIDPETLCPWESGMQLLRLPEPDFLTRILENNPKFGEKRAKAFYTALWKLLIDARTRERRKRDKEDRISRRKRDDKWHKEHLEEIQARDDEEAKRVQYRIRIMNRVRNQTVE